ncbi:MAG TPA: 2,3-bisphosphoglycerate-independent phosphoglycerate mutase [Chloroflexi bacterium]|nr:2,3-bisphosphoglycerate-independent phosphoglycerate mutase [Chloroflexota bacterium]
MTRFELLKELTYVNQTKIVLLVIDGLGGLPREPGGLTELEAAHTPNMDALAAKSICGLLDPITPGITPGSGPSHLALFGYDPLRYEIGRGVLEALGIGFPLEKDDLAARGNFCTVDENGLVTDRRAGRIPTSLNEKLCEELAQIELPGVKIFIRPVKEYRFMLVFRGKGLSEKLSETDPQRVGLAPLPVEPLAPEAEETARLVNTLVEKAKEILASHHPANMVLLRGFSKDPCLPKMQEVYKLKPAAIATYPMYRGVAKLVGMDLLDTGDKFTDEISTLESHWQEYDFFYVHVKKTDSYGEDGNFDARVALIEEIDQHIPRILALEPDVFIITGDHSTPSVLRSHSWHPVPVLLYSRYVRPDGLDRFGERACAQGSIGRMPAVNLMTMALAYALRLNKYGA